MLLLESCATGVCETFLILDITLIMVIVFSLFHLLVVVLCRSATPEHTAAQGDLKILQTDAVYIFEDGIRHNAG